MQAALAPLVRRVTVVFSHRPEGKRRTFVEHLELELTEELLQLLGVPKRVTCQLSPLARAT